MMWKTSQPRVVCDICASPWRGKPAAQYCRRRLTNSYTWTGNAAV